MTKAAESFAKEDDLKDKLHIMENYIRCSTELLAGQKFALEQYKQELADLQKPKYEDLITGIECLF